MCVKKMAAFRLRLYLNLRGFSQLRHSLNLSKRLYCTNRVIQLENTYLCMELNISVTIQKHNLNEKNIKAIISFFNTSNVYISSAFLIFTQPLNNHPRGPGTLQLQSKQETVIT